MNEKSAENRQIQKFKDAVKEAGHDSASDKKFDVALRRIGGKKSKPKTDG